MKTTITDTHIKCEMSLERLAAMADNGQKLFGQRDQHGVIEPSSLQWAVDAPFTDSEVVASVQSFLDAQDDYGHIEAFYLPHELAEDGELDGMGDEMLEYHIPRFVVEIDDSYQLKRDDDHLLWIYQGGNMVCEAFVPHVDEREEQMHNAGYVPTSLEYVDNDGAFNVMVALSDVKKFNFPTLEQRLEQRLEQEGYQATLITHANIADWQDRGFTSLPNDQRDALEVGCIVLEHIHMWITLFPETARAAIWWRNATGTTSALSEWGDLVHDVVTPFIVMDYDANERVVLNGDHS